MQSKWQCSALYQVLYYRWCFEALIIYHGISKPSLGRCNKIWRTYFSKWLAQPPTAYIKMRLSCAGFLAVGNTGPRRNLRCLLFETNDDLDGQSCVGWFDKGVGKFFLVNCVFTLYDIIYIYSPNRNVLLVNNGETSSLISSLHMRTRLSWNITKLHNNSHSAKQQIKITWKTECVPCVQTTAALSWFW